MARLGAMGFLETAIVVGNLEKISVDKDKYVDFNNATGQYARWKGC